MVVREHDRMLARGRAFLARTSESQPRFATLRSRARTGKAADRCFHRRDNLRGHAVWVAGPDRIFSEYSRVSIPSNFSEIIFFIHKHLPRSIQERYGNKKILGYNFRIRSHS